MPLFFKILNMPLPWVAILLWSELPVKKKFLSFFSSPVVHSLMFFSFFLTITSHLHIVEENIQY